MGPTDPAADAVTLGVEEEFLLVDPDSWTVATRAAEVLAAIPDKLRKYVHHELLETQLEVSSPVCRDLTELRDWLLQLRSGLADAARVAGCRLIAAGTSLLPGNCAPPIAPDGRYARMASEFRALVETPGLCALHVHVAVADRDLAAAVSNHLRPWLPVLQAIAVNSPYADGRDTGYASWRSIQWSRWPSCGPPPWLESAADQDQTVRDVIATGAACDTRMIYWYARLSPRYPTIEVRAGDVPADVQSTLLIAALTRGLVVNAITEIRAGRSALRPGDLALRAAHWRAARDGLEGQGMNPVTGDPVPIWELIDGLADRIAPALAQRGDEAAVQTLLAGVRATGSGAARQRAVYAATGQLVEVARYLTEATTAG